MPEGDTLYKAAAGVRPVLQGRSDPRREQFGPHHGRADRRGVAHRPDGHRGRRPWQAPDRSRWTTTRVVHSHLGMTGSWHVYPRGEAWRKPASQAALALETEHHAVICFSPKLLELVTVLSLRRNDYLRRLGPDLMRADCDLRVALQRMRTHPLAPIGEAVMNQTLIAGVGNVYKSETLFLARIDPWTRIGELPDDRLLLDYLAETSRLMRRNRGRGRRVTRYAGDGGRHWVYGRRGEPCYECG